MSGIVLIRRGDSHSTWLCQITKHANPQSSKYFKSIKKCCSGTESTKPLRSFKDLHMYLQWAWIRQNVSAFAAVAITLRKSKFKNKYSSSLKVGEISIVYCVHIVLTYLLISENQWYNASPWNTKRRNLTDSLFDWDKIPQFCFC